MKINRLVALALIALLVVTAMGVLTVRGLAKVSTPLIQQGQVTQPPDNDNIQEQTGNQNENDTNVEEQTGNQDETGTGTEVQDGQKTTESQGADSDPNQAALQSQAKITAEQAQQSALSANPGASVTKTELDNETGALIYSIELSNGSSVEVDAVTGQILKTEPAE
jgi:uncharacterized membrane protein YkoI